ncbi:hypothetical protein C4K68_22445 [Pokkaliibacter plantistimulans]|uniref:Uncharacterized protein n=1 Tax=Proteobacteria bacterium 228 TaxID=2083153 RepID=A0A2S5KJP5_9PROT|nr:hypothetical protein [Pokkaliibacter plantistimulans]PPC75054.1 hypothetical protein C4K68_22445 [Pokkaliibacter plantistimulans]
MGKFRFTDSQRHEFVESLSIDSLNKLRTTLIRMIATKKQAQRSMRKADPSFEINAKANNIGLDVSALFADASKYYR